MNLPSKTRLENQFRSLWNDLFTTRVHLDSALSKRDENVKGLLAQVIKPILLRPNSVAEAVGVGVRPCEPWCLSAEERASWTSAWLIARALHEQMDRGLPDVPASAIDFPPELYEAWESSFGAEAAKRLVPILGAEPPLFLRAAQSVGAEKLLASLRAGDFLPVKSRLSPVAPFAVELEGYAQVLRHPLYKEGAFEIQDVGSQWMALFALWPELYGPALQGAPGPVPKSWSAPPLPAGKTPAWTVVDACAGAGGKTLALADALAGGGRVYAYDTSDKKLAALKKRASRAGLRNVQSVVVQEGHEAETVKKFRRRADVVLVDSPCSGWGVLRRNPDIKWRQAGDELDRLPILQERLLGAYSELVKPGGRLVYGVCTFRVAETLGVVEAFASAHPDFEPIAGGYLGPGPCDGFFVQAWQRKAK